MPDILSIANTGIAAAQTAINVTGQNIANVSSTGYSRENVQQTSSNTGQGTQIIGVTRIYNDFLASQANSANTSSSSSSVQYAQVQALNSILTDPNAGISSTMSSFFNSLQDVANSPSDIAPRQSAIGAAQNLTSAINFVQSTIDNINSDINTQLTQSVTRINQYANQILTLNKQIVGTADQETLNSLKDQRDAVVNSLSKEIKVSVTDQNNQYSVSVGSGIPLLDSTQTFPLKTTSNIYNPSQTEVVLSGTNNSIFTTQNSPGGIIGGLINFRTKILNPASNSVGQVALSLATQVNNAQSLGSSLTAATPPTGQALFNVGNIFVKASANNQSNSNISVAFNSSPAANPNNPLDYLNQVTTSDYTFSFDGTHYQLTRDSDGAVLQSQTSTADMVADGMKISIPAGLQSGDSFKISPTANAARNFSLTTTDPLSIAAAAGGALTPANVSSGDNSNMVNLLNIQTNKLINGGSSNVFTAFNQFISAIGSQSHELQVQSTFDASVAQKSAQALQNDSGVNLDEEAANLIKFQQAYQASGKVMQVAKQMFDSLLNMAQ